MLKKAVTDDPVLHARTKDVGVLSYEEAVNFCAVGPTARASGLRMMSGRILLTRPMISVPWEMITCGNGDVFDKLVVRILETFESIKIVKYCLEHLPDGPIDLGLKDVPAGEGIGHIEAPARGVFSLCAQRRYEPSGAPQGQGADFHEPSDL